MAKGLGGQGGQQKVTADARGWTQAGEAMEAVATGLRGLGGFGGARRQFRKPSKSDDE